MSYIEYLTVDDVRDADSFAQYSRQVLGVPVFRRDINVMKGAVKEFLELNPTASWQTLGRTARWCSDKQLRPRNLIAIVHCVKLCYGDGRLPELERNYDAQLEADIDAALEVETDRYWRTRLMTSVADGRVLTYRQWRQERQPYYGKAMA